MLRNPIQFAVVREDPELEAQIVRQRSVRSALVIGSGGCTALSLAAWFPQLDVAVVDPNVAQLKLLNDKRATLSASGSRRRFNIESDAPTGLNNCGNFESLFAGLRRFLHDFVFPADEIRNLFAADSALASVERLFAIEYWPVAFDLFFSDPLLRTMFGEEAIQHAPPGSYPRYFQRAFERGLRSPTRYNNYFLHHALLGMYLDRPDSLPHYLLNGTPIPPFDMFEGYIPDVPDIARYQLVSLSNISDWMSDEQLKQLAAFLAEHLRPGTILLMRQLNNERDLATSFRGFRFEPVFAQQLLAKDRSLFYSQILVATKE